MNYVKVERDKYGIVLKYPQRTCKKCKLYPCFPEIKKCYSDFIAFEAEKQ